MKKITKDKKVEAKEKIQEEIKKTKKENFDEAKKEFQESAFYPYLVSFFEKEEKRIADQLNSIQYEEMKSVFLLPTAKERNAKIQQMSKRDTILTGVLGSLKNIKRKLV